ncbi:hypothetical protein [Kocuria turfanensis]|uniref:Gram-positive cocci surface proteins LPxTG domain-containing protein n=1 Tax=Kocuria turfanensis TaxID=388357 RepID=A0A512IB64_9MICC|nr:hypothetical protein [Kocuria turfanensis]GEO94936.1 hypothetical protein KTU01_10590 [Kocuria turfanensis]
MTAVKKWVAAGSSAAVLAGGLFLGAPAAHADTCAAPEMSATVSNLVTAADHLHDTSVHFNSLVADAGTLAQLEAAQADLEHAIVHADTMGPARDAWNTILGLQQGYADATEDPAVDEAYAASSSAAAHFQTAATDARAQGEVYMEDGAALLALFQGNCGGLLTGTGDWTGTEGDSAAGVNEGINMQTAEESGPGAGVLAALLASVAAVAGAVAFRVRRARA